MLEISTERNGNATLVTLKGRLDTAAALKCENKFFELDEATHETIHLECKELEYTAVQACGCSWVFRKR